MALIDYVDLATMKVYSNLDADTKYDALLEDAITSASREVDRRTDRYFGVDDTASQRTFDCYGDGVLVVDDISSETDLQIEGESPKSTHKLMPRNRFVAGEPHPITYIKSDNFCEGESYTVTAIWGWPEVPDVITEVTKMLAAETFIARETPHGVAGIDGTGFSVRMRERVTIERKLHLYERDPVGLA